MINDVIKPLNNPNVDIFELQRNFLHDILKLVIKQKQKEAIMAALITNNETIGLSNKGMDAKREMLMKTINYFYNLNNSIDNSIDNSMDNRIR